MRSWNGRWVLAIACALVVAGAAGAVAPRVVTHQGVLLDSAGNPIVGPVDIAIRIWDQPTGGSLLYAETHPGVTLVDGAFNILLGTGAVPEGSFDAELFAELHRYLEVTVGTEAPEPRRPFISVAYALQAEALGGVTAARVESLEAIVTAQQTAIDALQQELSELSTLLEHVSRNGNDIYITGANLHVVNGSGATDKAGEIDGVGNLIIGYNELRGDATNERSGWHNLIVGERQSYNSYGGLVAGAGNSILGPYAAVSGGAANTASASYASVSGGASNAAERYASSVSGGRNNIASGPHSAVSGGSSNTASGRSALVGGGTRNVAKSRYASVSGGRWNTASAYWSSISGGRGNTAAASYASVGGGGFNTAEAPYASVSGGTSNTASASYASVSGGRENMANRYASSVSGGRSNTASGQHSSVSGGRSNTASGQHSSVSGGWSNAAEASYAAVSGVTLFPDSRHPGYAAQASLA